MKNKLKPITQEQMDIIDGTFKTGKERCKYLFINSATTVTTEMLTSSHCLDSDMTEDEMEAKYRGIIEGQTLGYLLGSALALTDDPRKTILDLTEGSLFHARLKDMFGEWDRQLTELDLIELFQETLRSAVEDGFIVEDDVSDHLMN